MAGCKILNVAEKNDAARELSNVMSRGRFSRVRSASPQGGGKAQL